MHGLIGVWNRRRELWGQPAARLARIKGWRQTTQLALAAIMLAPASWFFAASVDYLGSASSSSEQLRQLEQAYAELEAETELSIATLISQIEALEKRSQHDRTVIDELGTIKATLNRQLESRERQLAMVIEQRNHARGLVGDMQQAVAGAEDLLKDVLRERSALQHKLAAAQQKLAAADQQRHAGREVEVGLRWQLARLESEVEHLQDAGENARVWLKDWVLGSVEALEDLVTETGVDVNALVARASGEPLAGQGGPLQAAASFGDPAPPATAPGHPMGDDIQRLAALQRLARSLPLASPLDQFHLTSRYGKRRDPFTKSWAFHAGLDLGAPRNSEVLATAPGQVIAAGAAGPYGQMVEIDHGMGIITRYAHLKTIAVQVGDAVDFRQPLGVIGNTGRSTSRHLHYEVRIDDAPYDPSKFLDAGRLLVGVFDVSQSGVGTAANGG